MKKEVLIIKSLLCTLALVLLSQFSVFAQQNTVSGKVTDNNRKALVGVTINVRGTSTGTVTNISGEFSLNVMDTATLIVSYVGYKTKEVPIKGQQSLNIILQSSATGLNEVVVVGYGTQKKANLTGAVSVVGKKLLENRPVSNATQALQGAAPGLIITRTNGQPGKEGWKVNIRGYSSLNGSNSPNILIDGVPGNLSDINPNDIASISVLKDAAASSIYGAEASGGVILITTKKGSPGKLKVNYTGLYTIKKHFLLPSQPDSWKTSEMRNLANKNAGRPDSWSPTDIRLMKKQDPDSLYIYNSPDPSLNGTYYNRDPVPLLIRNSSPSWTHNLSVSGGSDKTDYFISLGYYHENGIFKLGPDNYKRYNARLNITNHFSSVFSLNSRISYTQSNIESPIQRVNGDYGMLYNIFRIRRIYPLWLPGTNNTKYANPFAYALLKEGGYNHSNRYNFNGNFTLKATNLIKGLDLRAIYYPRMQQYNTENFKQTIPVWSYNSQSVPVISRYSNKPNSISKGRQTIFAQDLQFLLDYDWQVAKEHHFHVLGGFEYKFNYYDNISAAQSNLISNNIASLNMQASATTPPSAGDNIQTNAWISYFGRLNYNFKGKYLVQATIRNDASSKLAPGHRSQTFPAVSAGWIMSKEPWFNSNLPFFNELKIRGSWGKQGNAHFGGNYDYIGRLRQGGAYPFNNVANPSIYQSVLPASGLGWETIEQSNVGIDFALFQSHLTGSFDYFIRYNNNMLITVNEPAVLGVSPSKRNAASMKTWGWGFNVGWKDEAGEVSYYINFNLSDNKNKITRYLGNIVIRSGNNTAIPGYPINSLFGYVAQGYFQTKDQVTKHAFQDNRTGPGDIVYKDINSDGKINQGNNTISNHGDMVYLGTTSPRYNYGLQMGMAYKGFDFSVFFQGVGKRNFQIYSRSLIPWIQSWRAAWTINEDYWTPENPDAKFPRLYLGGTHNTVVSTHWIQNAAYIMLKNIQLGYTLPKRMTKKIGITKARIFFSGQDLWQATKAWYKYFNPESPQNASFEYPLFHSYAFGINLTL